MTSVAPVAVVLVQRDQPTVEAQGASPPSHDALPPLNSPSYPPQPGRESWVPCESDPDLFFPSDDEDDDEDSPDPRVHIARAKAVRDQIARAKAVCRLCPGVVECLERALLRDEEGIWGGLTKEERDALKRWRTQAPRLIGRAS